VLAVGRLGSRYLSIYSSTIDFESNLQSTARSVWT
jgi:hypothetical protein